MRSFHVDAELLRRRRRRRRHRRSGDGSGADQSTPGSKVCRRRKRKATLHSPSENI